MSEEWEWRRNDGEQPTFDTVMVDVFMSGAMFVGRAGNYDWSTDVMEETVITKWRLHRNEVQIDPEDVEFAGDTPADLHAKHFNEPLVTDEEMKMLNEPTEIMERQEGGQHYKKHEVQPWHIVDMYELNFYEGNIIKYMLRDKDNRLEDLKKARHYLDKLISMEEL